MNWNQFEKEIKKLAAKIDCRIDIIVGVARGGLIPARMLAKALKVKDMYCMTVRKVGGERRVVTEVLDDLTGKNFITC